VKKAIVLSTSDAAFSALSFKGDLIDGIKMAKELGYDGVEIAIRDPRVVDPLQIKKIADENKIKIVAIGTGQAYNQEGLYMTSPDEDVRKKTIERLMLQIDFASYFGAHLIIGLIRGSIEGISYEEGVRLFIEGLKDIGGYAREKGIKIVIEPINRYELNFINCVDDALPILDKVDMPHVGLLLDTFHMNIEEPIIEESVKKAGDNILHFHVADSNRWPPGYGHLDFESIFSALFSTGYNGYVSGEMLPKPTPYESMRKTIEYLNNMSRKLHI